MASKLRVSLRVWPITICKKGQTGFPGHKRAGCLLQVCPSPKSVVTVNDLGMVTILEIVGERQ